MPYQKFRVLFMGTPEFAVPTLNALAQHHEVVAVVTQPDRARGRGRTVASPPVGIAARRLGLELVQVETLRGKGIREQLAAYQADVCVVVAFGKILPKGILDMPRLGCVNVHASLLPRYRGAAPIQRAVLDGAVCSGVTVMQMDAGVDTGAIWLQQSIPLEVRETAGTLHDKLAPLGAALLIDALELIGAGQGAPKAQDDMCATQAPTLSKDEGRVDFNRTSKEVSCWVRGMDPWPGAFALINGEVIKLFGAVATAEREAGRPGQVLCVDARGLLVACASGAVWLEELQIAGRRRMPARAFVSGHPIIPGSVFE